MINKIKSTNQNIKFKGTTIIKQEGGSILNKNIMNAVNSSSLGYTNTRLDGYSVVIVADVFKKEEQNFLKELDKKKLTYVNFTEVFNYKLSSVKELIKTITKTGLI